MSQKLDKTGICPECGGDMYSYYDDEYNLMTSCDNCGYHKDLYDE